VSANDDARRVLAAMDAPVFTFIDRDGYKNSYPVVLVFTDGNELLPVSGMYLDDFPMGSAHRAHQGPITIEDDRISGPGWSIEDSDDPNAIDDHYLYVMKQYPSGRTLDQEHAWYAENMLDDRYRHLA